MLRPELISQIVEKELEGAPDAIRRQGNMLLKQWLEQGSGSDFCDKSVRPAINRLNMRLKKRAWHIFHEVKDRISAHAIDDMRMREKHRRSVEEMKKELVASYELIEKQGRGVVYFGSARSKPGDSDYEAGRELGREVAQLLGVTSWSGAGPGAMEAPLRGAKEAGGKIGGIKIRLTHEDNAFEQEVSSVFSQEEVAICNFFGPRKVGLVDAGMAEKKGDKRGFFFLPGGFGTEDEFFEILTLAQLDKVGSADKVPVLLMNYGGYFDTKIKWMKEMVQRGKVSEKDLNLFTVCNTNEEALDHLANTYSIPDEKRTYKGRLLPSELWFPHNSSEESSHRRLNIVNA